MVKETSEDKLLAVIESHAASEKNKEVAVFKKDKGDESKKKWIHFLSARIFNKILAGACAVITIFFISDFSYRHIALRNSFMEMMSGKDQPSAEGKNIPQLEINFPDIVSSAEKRNMFSLVLPDGTAPVIVKTEADASAILSNLKVAAVIWSEENSQVMMEDVKENKSFLLKEKDVVNGFTVKTIQKNSVILEKNGKEWMLR